MADMTLEQVRNWHCRFAETHNEDDTNTFHTKMAAAIDAAIRERDRLRGDVAGMTEELLHVPSREEWRELQKRAERTEAELAESRETIKRLNRRAQVAEAGVVEKVKEHAGGSLGRALANAAADMYMRERDEAQAELAALKARIAESAHVDVTLGCAIDGDIPGDLALCRVALVKMED